MNTLNFLEAVNSLDEDVLKETFTEDNNVATQAKTQTRRKKGWTVVNGLNEDALEELLMEEEPAKKETQTSTFRPRRKIVRAACFLIPCLIAILLFSHLGSASQGDQTLTEPAGYQTGALDQLYLYYQGKLYEYVGYVISPQALPFGAEIVGTVESQDNGNLPKEELSGSYVPVGTPIMKSSKVQADILYVYHPQDLASRSSFYSVFIPGADPGKHKTAEVDSYRGCPLLCYKGRRWVYWDSRLSVEKLDDTYVESGEVQVQLTTPVADGVYREDCSPEKEGEAIVFSPGMKIYVLEEEKAAPTHLYIQIAPDQYIYLFPSEEEILISGK